MEWINELNKFLLCYKFTGEIKFNLPSDKFSIQVKYNNIEINRNYTLDYFITNIDNCFGNIRDEIFYKTLKRDAEEIITNITNISNDNLLELNNKFSKLETSLLNLVNVIDDVVK